MKILDRGRLAEISFKPTFLAGIVACGMFVWPGPRGDALARLAVSDAPGVTATAAANPSDRTEEQSSPVQAPSSNVQFPNGIEDILKMTKAKVDPDVILTFIKGSPVAYRLGADEIIALHREGVPGKIIAAMLQRGATLRGKESQTAQAGSGQFRAAPTPSPSTRNAAPYPYGYSTYAYPYSPEVIYNNSYPVYTYGYPVYSYAYYGWPFYTSYAWPFGYSYYRHWPGYYGYRRFGFYPYRSFGYDHRFGGFNHGFAHRGPFIAPRFGRGGSPYAPALPSYGFHGFGRGAPFRGGGGFISAPARGGMHSFGGGFHGGGFSGGMRGGGFHGRR